jgi:16S rRNA (guanine527-N7)-methyltransferase
VIDRITDLDKRKKIEKFFSFLKESKHNLISSGTKRNFEVKHFEDIYIPIDHISIGEKNIDVGTGGGIPGIVLSIFFDKSDWILLDSISKKVNELGTFIHQLGLSNVSLVSERVESFSENNLNSFDSIFFRAVARTDICLEYACPLVKNGGNIYIYKGPNFISEKKYFENACNLLGIEFIRKIEYTLSDGSSRNLLIFKKVSDSKIRLPRKVGLAKKRPIGEFL